MRCVEPKFLGKEKCAAGFELTKEQWSLNDFPEDVPVLLVQKSEALQGFEYQHQRLPRRPRCASVRKAASLYTRMGRRAGVRANPISEDILARGTRRASGGVKAAVKLNLGEVTPDAWEPPFSASNNRARWGKWGRDTPGPFPVNSADNEKTAVAGAS